MSVSDGDPTKTTLGELYDRLPEADRKKMFFFLFGIVEFYADEMTWFAVMMMGDPPCGAISKDFRKFWDMNGNEDNKPGGRARLAISWVISSFKRVHKPEDP